MQKKMFQPSLQKRLETDQRKPVLLLRSFKWDNAIVERDFLWGNRTLEEKLTKVLKEIGPVIALGSPKDILRPVGAARTYVDSDKDRWTEEIKELLSMAQLYIAILDFTESLEWELNYVKDQGYLDKLVIIFPWWLLWEDRKQWINSYNEARKRVKFLPPFKKSILGVWYGGTDEHTLITSNAETDSTDEYIERITEFLRKTISIRDNLELR